MLFNQGLLQLVSAQEQRIKIAHIKCSQVSLKVILIK